MMFFGENDPIFPNSEIEPYINNFFGKLGVMDTIKTIQVEPEGGHVEYLSFFNTMMEFVRGDGGGDDPSEGDTVEVDFANDGDFERKVDVKKGTKVVLKGKEDFFADNFWNLVKNDCLEQMTAITKYRDAKKAQQFGVGTSEVYFVFHSTGKSTDSDCKITFKKYEGVDAMDDSPTGIVTLAFK